MPKGGGTYRVGKPYVVAGRTYVPEEDPNYRAEGLASWYGDAFHGRLTANGEVFDMTSLTAAHPTLPLPSYARVTNLANGKSVIVRVNDRGPYHGNRLIDVSNTAAKLLEFRDNGIGRVRVEYVGRAPLEGSDDRQLMATLRTGEPAPSPSSVRIASAHAFIPDLPPSRGVVRADVPLPAGRPYTLGHTPDDAATGSSEVSASARRPKFGGRRFEQAAPVEADAAEDHSRDDASGRGLCTARQQHQPDVGSRALLRSAFYVFQKLDQRGVDLIGALLLNPVTGAFDNQFAFQVRHHALHLGDAFAAENAGDDRILCSPR